MNGIIGINNLQIHCIIGNNSEERIITQCLLVDVKVKGDFSRCGVSDRIQDTVDYTQIAQMCTELAIGRQYRLLETFAWEAVHRLLEELQVQWAWICIKKPGGLESAQQTFVEFSATRSAQIQMEKGEG